MRSSEEIQSQTDENVPLQGDKVKISTSFSKGLHVDTKKNSMMQAISEEEEKLNSANDINSPVKSALNNQPGSATAKRSTFFGFFGRNDSRSSSVASSPGPKRVSLMERFFKKNPTGFTDDLPDETKQGQHNNSKSKSKHKGKKKNGEKNNNHSMSEGTDSETEEKSDKDMPKGRGKSKTMNHKVHPSGSNLSTSDGSKRDSRAPSIHHLNEPPKRGTFIKRLSNFFLGKPSLLKEDIHELSHHDHAEADLLLHKIEKKDVEKPHEEEEEFDPKDLDFLGKDIVGDIKGKGQLKAFYKYVQNLLREEILAEVKKDNDEEEENEKVVEKEEKEEEKDKDQMAEVGLKKKSKVFGDELLPFAEMIQEYEDADSKVTKEKNIMLYTEKKNPFEILEIYADSYPFLAFRKKLLYFSKVVSWMSQKIIKHSIFESTSLVVILANSVFLMLDDPTSKTVDPIREEIDFAFLIIYTIEMFLKIFAMGFMFNKGSYLREGWNILDFTIVFTAYLPYFVSSDINLSSLRSLRVLRPLRTISTVRSLKVLLTTLFSALPMLLNALLILMFFFLIFAIGGLQLFSGLLKKQCFSEREGKPVDSDNGMLCGYKDCPDGYICGKMIRNPNYGVMNFDNILSSFMMVFQCVTLEGWSSIMYALVRTFTIYVFVYFVALIFVGSFFLLNLTLAVIKVKYNEAQHAKREGIHKKKEERKVEIEVKELQSFKRIERAHHVRNRYKKGLTMDNVGHHEESHDEKLKFDLRWDDLLELKERIRMEQQRQEDEDNFVKTREENINNEIIDSPKNRVKRVKIEQKIDFEMVKRSYENTKFEVKPDNRVFKLAGISGVRRNNFMHDTAATIDNSNQIRTTFSFLRKGSKKTTRSLEKKLSVVNHSPLGGGSEADKSREELFNGSSNHKNNNNHELTETLLQNNETGQPNENNENNELNGEDVKTNLNQSENTELNDKPEMEKIETELKKSKKVYFQQMAFSTLRKKRKQPNLVKKFNEANLEEISLTSEESERILPKESVDDLDDFKNDGKPTGDQFLDDITMNESMPLPQKTAPKPRDASGRDKTKIKQRTKGGNGGKDNSRSKSYESSSLLNDSDFNTHVLLRQKTNTQSEEITGDIFAKLEEEAEEDFKQVSHLKRGSILEYDRSKINIPVTRENIEQSEFMTKNKSLAMFVEGVRKNSEIVGPRRSMRKRSSIMKTLVNFKGSQEPKNEELELAPITQFKIREKLKNRNFFQRSFATRAFQKIGIGGNQAKSNQGNNANLQFIDDLKPRVNIRHFKLMVDHEKEIVTNSEKDVLLRYQPEVFEKKRLEEIIMMREKKYPINFKQKDVRLKELKNIKEMKFLKRSKRIKISPKLQIFLSTLSINSISARLLLNKGKYKLPMTLQRTFLMIKENSKKKKMVISTTATSKMSKDETIGGPQKGITKKGLLGKRAKIEDDEIDWTFEGIKALINMKIKPNDKEFEYDPLQEIYDLQEADYVKNLKTQHIYSGDEIFSIADGAVTNYSTIRVNKLFRVLTSANYDTELWLKGFEGWARVRRKNLLNFIKGSLFEGFLTLCVIANTVILAMDGLFDDEASLDIMDQISNVFTIVFAIEMFLKLIALGLKRYCRDVMNIFDGAVVIISLVEMIFLGGGKSLSAFRTVRIFRTFRVLRVTRLLRSLAFIKVIVDVINKTLTDFIYIALLLLLFSLIYSLLGTQFFGGEFNFPDNRTRQNFDSFSNAFICVFQILTVENWPDILVVCMRSSVPSVLTAIYLISWICIGNFIFLNLFLAILIDGFEIDSIEEDLFDSDEEQFAENLNLLNKDNDEYHFDILSGKRKEFIKPLFHKIECEVSIYLFSKQSKFRIGVYKLVVKEIFDNIILVFIVLSSFKLVMDSYVKDQTSDVAFVSNYIDYAFNSVFTLEMFLKVIAYGFANHDGCYLRDTWNVLDFIIVVSALLDMSIESIDIPVIKVLRLLRTLRPLRFISHNISMRVVVRALMDSVTAILNVLIVIGMIWLMFGILGISLLGGRMGYCYMDNYWLVNKDACIDMGYEWKNFDVNFDNIIRAMISLFIISSLEGWPDLMFRAMDSNLNDVGPEKNNYFIISLYYILFIILGNFFLLNLFIGVIFLHFSFAQKKEKAAKDVRKGTAIFLTNEQNRWMELQKMILNAKPQFEQNRKPKTPFNLFFYRVINYKYFDGFVMVCIVFNIMIMAMSYEGSSPDYDSILENINLFFTSVFILEMILKIFAINFKPYWGNAWNRFDFFVVMTSIIDIAMNAAGQGTFEFLRIGPQLARIMRVLRVTRLLKLVKSLQGLQKLLETLMVSLTSLLNVGALLFLVFFIFSILGVFIFQDVKDGVIIDEYNNFENFGSSMLLLFRCSTGEDWYKVMFDVFRTSDCIEGYTCGTVFAPIYFIFFIMICNFIMLNLFILIIIDQFEQYEQLGDCNPVQVFKEHMESFRKVWSIYTEKSEGLCVNQKNLIDFFKTIEPPMGFQKTLPRPQIAKQIMNMHILGDDDGNVYFRELLFASMKKGFGGDLILKDASYEVKELLGREELATRRRIEHQKKKMIKKEKRKRMNMLKKQQTSAMKDLKQNSKSSSKNLLETQATIANNSKKVNVVNPIFMLLFMGMSFKAWKNFATLKYNGELDPNDSLIKKQSAEGQVNEDDEEGSFFSDGDDNDDDSSEKKEEHGIDSYNFGEEDSTNKLPRSTLKTFKELENQIQEEEESDEEDEEERRRAEERRMNSIKKKTTIINLARRISFAQDINNRVDKEKEKEKERERERVEEENDTIGSNRDLLMRRASIGMQRGIVPDRNMQKRNTVTLSSLEMRRKSQIGLLSLNVAPELTPKIDYLSVIDKNSKLFPVDLLPSPLRDTIHKSDKNLSDIPSAGESKSSISRRNSIKRSVDSLSESSSSDDEDDDSSK